MFRLSLIVLWSFWQGFYSATAVADEHERPNILWISSEDNGPELGCYGDTTAKTPNLDRLATTGVVYRNCWSVAPVCAPARTAIISGLYPTTTGSHHMRSHVVRPVSVELYPQILRRAGYYCSNRSKEDYNLTQPFPLWDDSSPKAHWRNRAANQPFFSVVNFTTTHESQIRVRPHEAITSPQDVKVPPFHPDLPEIRKDWAQYYDNIAALDQQIGDLLEELEHDGLRDNTIIFYFGDHGTGMPRGKRWLYESGLRVPMIVWAPEKYHKWLGDEYRPGETSQRLVSFVDLYPTILSILGLPSPEQLAGSAFLGPSTSESPQYVFACRDRMDERYDLSRAVRDAKFSYIRNYLPHRIQGQYLDYMFQTPTAVAWKTAFERGQCNEVQSRFWLPKPSEELYDLESDPFQINNLASRPEYRSTLERFRERLHDHLLASRDLGFLPESEMLRRSAETSPYEYGLSEQNYPLSKILLAAELATRLDLGGHESLDELLLAEEPAVRYWAAIGLLWRGLQTNDTAFHQTRWERFQKLAEQDPSRPVRGVANEWLARLAKLGSSEHAAEIRQAALDRLVVEATSEESTYFDAVEQLNFLVHSEPTAGELAKHWNLLSQLNRSGEPRVEFYLQRLLDSLPRQLNVIVLVSDDQRWDSLGVAGNPLIHTPNLDRLAGSGVYFPEARVTTSICMTSRASILTGQYMSRHGIDRFGKAIPPTAFQESYCGKLSAAGYWTGFVGKYGVGAARREDFDFLRSYESAHWLNRDGQPIHITEQNRRDAIEFLQTRPKDRPFLLNVSFFAGHAEDGHPDQYRPQPWSEVFYRDKVVPPAKFADPRFLKALPPFLSDAKNEGRVRFGWRFDTAEKYQRSMVNYYRLLTEMDAAVGDVLAELQAQNLDENTLVVFIGDNGYFHGDRGLADKWYPYEQALRVPLIVFDPRLPKSRRGQKYSIQALNIDVAPTVISAANLKVPDRVQGANLSDVYLLSPPANWRESFFYEHPTITNRERIPASQAIVSREFKLISWPEWDFEQLFDLRSNDEEIDNLIHRPEYLETATRLRRELTELREKAR
ncbi:MAG: sulfatase-like hydrolase/transferase [Planctomycetaceae bacterium]|nr:sulfatase-like hydrolase/transferase [Planctomycetaceae bacterium]